MVLVAYVDDNKFYVHKGPLIEPVIAPSVEVDDPDNLVPDVSSSAGLMKWGASHMSEAAILADDSLTEELLVEYPCCLWF